MIWCPYSGVDADPADCTLEHIIPLSLGGSNGFTVPVDAALNAQVGSEIDAALSSKDFLTAFRRRQFDARGHSNKAPEVRVRSATYGPDQRPAQVTLKGEKGTTVWDARDRREVPDEELVGQKIQLKFTIQPYDRLRFLAKVCLSAGYAIYGDLFRKTADHASVRALMNAKSRDEAKEVLAASNLRGHFEHYPVPNQDLLTVQRDMAVCATVDGSVVLSVLTQASVVFTVGILGQWIGMLNVPAITDDYPIDDRHDLGHAVLLVDAKTERMSYREFLSRALERFTGAPVVLPSQAGGTPT